ncbi:MAG TPA: hypothetical protein VHE83_15160 [Mycobacteriales bacterium]|nr:hypothetical protein [Mycobacteriales bacterium]
MTRPGGSLAATGGTTTSPVVAALTLVAAWILNRRGKGSDRDLADTADAARPRVRPGPSPP